MASDSFDLIQMFFFFNLVGSLALICHLSKPYPLSAFSLAAAYVPSHIY